jgi:hypothetical protein
VREGLADSADDGETAQTAIEYDNGRGGRHLVRYRTSWGLALINSDEPYPAARSLAIPLRLTM